jgi:hypothetical protein
VLRISPRSVNVFSRYVVARVHKSPSLWTHSSLSFETLSGGRGDMIKMVYKDIVVHRPVLS